MYISACGSNSPMIFGSAVVQYDNLNGFKEVWNVSDRILIFAAIHSAINRRFWFVNPRMTKFAFFEVFWL